MFNLILKDIVIQKKGIAISLLYSLLIFAMFRQPEFAPFVYIMGSIGTAYILSMGATGLDDRYKAEVLLNSLPIPRRDIVLAKYLAILIFSVIGLAITGLTGAIMKTTGLGGASPRFISGLDMEIVVVSMLIMAALYYPLYYKLGYQLTRYLNLILFLVLFFAPSFLVSLVKEHMPREQAEQLVRFLVDTPKWEIGLIPVAAASVLAFLSFILSVKFYSKKDL